MESRRQGLLVAGKIQAVKFTFSFSSQVVEKTEHADLWLEAMTLSGTEALFGLLKASNPALQQTVLCAIKNLAAHPKMARLFIDYGLESVTQLLSCKVESCWGRGVNSLPILGVERGRWFTDVADKSQECCFLY